MAHRPVDILGTHGADDASGRYAPVHCKLRVKRQVYLRHSEIVFEQRQLFFYSAEAYLYLEYHDALYFFSHRERLVYLAVRHTQAILAVLSGALLCSNINIFDSRPHGG